MCIATATLTALIRRARVVRAALLVLIARIILAGASFAGWPAAASFAIIAVHRARADVAIVVRVPVEDATALRVAMVTREALTGALIAPLPSGSPHATSLIGIHVIALDRSVTSAGTVVASEVILRIPPVVNSTVLVVATIIGASAVVPAFRIDAAVPEVNRADAFLALSPTSTHGFRGNVRIVMLASTGFIAARASRATLVVGDVAFAEMAIAPIPAHIFARSDSHLEIRTVRRAFALRTL
eukprot:1086842-Rhodomonas_salina.2